MKVWPFSSERDQVELWINGLGLEKYLLNGLGLEKYWLNGLG